MAEGNEPKVTPMSDLERDTIEHMKDELSLANIHASKMDRRCKELEQKLEESAKQYEERVVKLTAANAEICEANLNIARMHADRVKLREMIQQFRKLDSVTGIPYCSQCFYGWPDHHLHNPNCHIAIADNVAGAGEKLFSELTALRQFNTKLDDIMAELRPGAFYLRPLLIGMLAELKRELDAIKHRP